MIQLTVPDRLAALYIQHWIDDADKIRLEALIVRDTNEDLLLFADIPVDTANRHPFPQRSVGNTRRGGHTGGVDSEIVPRRSINRRPGIGAASQISGTVLQRSAAVGDRRGGRVKRRALQQI